jgi:hypothetical protein
MRRLVLLALISTVASTPVWAQLRIATGIHPAATVPALRPGIMFLERTSASAPQTAAVSREWKWAASGAAIAAVIVGAYGAGQQARVSGDTFLRQPVLRFAALGAVGGAVIGTLAHAAIHRATPAMAPNGR